MLKHFIGTKLIKAKPMTRAEYVAHRNWDLPADENGADRGYLVEYLDGGKPNHPQHLGYISWSPAEQFDKAYRSLSEGRLTFGDALLFLEAGERVARAGWNGKGMWLVHIPHWDAPRLKVLDGSSVQFNTLPFIAMRVVTGELVPWLASQTDVLAKDWNLII